MSPHHSVTPIVSTATATTTRHTNSGSSWTSHWVDALSILREMLVVSTLGVAAAVLVAAYLGWANPFVNDTEPSAVKAFTVWMVANLTLITTFAVCPVVAFLLVGQQTLQLSVWQSAWITAKLSWKSTLLGAVVTTATTMLLFQFNVPVIQYHLHTSFSFMIISLCVLRIISNTMRLRRVHHLSQHPRPLVSVSSPSRTPTWRSTLRKILNVSLPSSVGALVTIEYIGLARHVQLDSVESFMWFSGASVVLKTLLPLLTKLYMAKRHVRNFRNTLFMITAPVLHVEIQIRMALLRAGNNLPVYAASAFVGLLEIAMRLAAAALDIVIIHWTRRRLAREKQLLIIGHQSTKRSQHEPPITGVSTTLDSAQLRSQLAQLDAKFVEWEHGHLRVSAAEILADMAAEYCGIGLVAMYMVVLHGNKSIDMSHSTLPMKELLGQQAVSWSTQMAFELATDFVSVVVEMHLGMPLLATLVEDRDKFLRWTIAVVAAHASGIYISSLVVSTVDD